MCDGVKKSFFSICLSVYQFSEHFEIGRTWQSKNKNVCVTDLVQSSGIVRHFWYGQQLEYGSNRGRRKKVEFYPKNAALFRQTRLGWVWLPYLNNHYVWEFAVTV